MQRTAPGEMPVVYDFGMNNGDDSAYYLAKGFRVVGVDANPAMCASCSERFDLEIRERQMTVLNVGLGHTPGEQIFSVNTAKHAISTFAPENFQEAWVPQSWLRIPVKVVRASDLIARYGQPHFIKIDVEFYDRDVLKDLLNSDIRPAFISAEAHHPECLKLLAQMGYSRFRLVPGETVSACFGNAHIRRLDGALTPFEFKYDSSGPFGEDLPTPWETLEDVEVRLMEHGLGWIDIHAAA